VIQYVRPRRVRDHNGLTYDDAHVLQPRRSSVNYHEKDADRCEEDGHVQ